MGSLEKKHPYKGRAFMVPPGMQTAIKHQCVSSTCCQCPCLVAETERNEC